jgi:AcrR family transcriptional regulator
MPVPRSKQQAVLEFRRAGILDAARKVFSQRSYPEVTVDDIAEASSITKATVYQYFASKQEIYLAALRQGITEMMERTREAMDAAEDVHGKIEAFVRTRLAYLEQHRDFFSVYHAEFGNLTHPASLNREFCELYRRQLEHLEAMLRAGIRRREIPTIPVQTVATTLYEATRGLMLRRMLGWSSVPVEREVAALVDLLWKGIATR